MSTAVCLFGSYPNLPVAIRKAGRQATYGGGHAIYVQRADAPYTPPFLDEFTGETGRVTDCVPASGVRGVNFMTAGAKAPCTPAEREALQAAMGTTGTSATESQLAAGVKRRYGLTVTAGRSWSAVVDALGGEDASVIVGDPLGTHDVTARLGDLQAFAAGLQNRYALFPGAVELPDTSTSQPKEAPEMRFGGAALSVEPSVPRYRLITGANFRAGPSTKTPALQDDKVVGIPKGTIVPVAYWVDGESLGDDDQWAFALMYVGGAYINGYFHRSTLGAPEAAPGDCSAAVAQAEQETAAKVNKAWRDWLTSAPMG